MENNELNLGRWVDERLASLNDQEDWHPDAHRALARLRNRGQVHAVTMAEDHLDRLLPENVEAPWFVGIWRNLRERVHPEEFPPLDVSSKPVPVEDIWGLYPTRRKSMLYSLAFQGAVVSLLFGVSFNPTVRSVVRTRFDLVAPILEPLKPQQKTMQGGGGSGDRSPMAAAKGALPKIATKQFVPPTEIIRNQNPKLAIEMTIVAPPDVAPPNVDMTTIGDPLAKLGPPSNGMGAGGGIGSGHGGGIGPGEGPGFGLGSGGGFNGGPFRMGGGVSAPVPIYKIDPEYSEEARKAKFSGIVLLELVVGIDGKPTGIKVIKGVGLGLDEKAIEAVQKWKFLPGKKDGQPVPVYAQVEVRFTLL